MEKPHGAIVKKLTIVVSDVDKAIAFEWMALHLRFTYDINFLFFGKKEAHLVRFLRGQQIPHLVVGYSGPFAVLRSFIKTIIVLRREKPHIVHTHLWRATLLGIPAAWFLRVPKRVITRHHAMVHYREFPSGRKWDRLTQRLATNIVAISENTQNILIRRDRANPAKVTLIHHGFDLSQFEEVTADRIADLRARYQTGASFPVIGVVARYLEWKGIEFVIQAFSRLRGDYPTAKLLLANAKGSYATQLKTFLQRLPVDSYFEIEFEQDIPALYHSMDVYVHVPIDPESEAFGQTYVESLAAGVPSVFTLSGVAPEFVRNEYNALVVPFRDAEAIHLAIKKLLKDQELRERLISNGRKSASLFLLERMIGQLKELYGS